MIIIFLFINYNKIKKLVNIPLYCTLSDDWVTLMDDVLNFNSMIYHSTRKTILSGNSLSSYITNYISYFHAMFFDITIKVIYFTISIVVG